MEWPLLIELIHHTKSTLDSIKKYTQLSREKFSDKEFGEFFYRMITKEIEKNDLLMNSYLNFIKVTTPLIKKGTVNTLIEEVLEKNQVQLEELRGKIFRNFEKDLPEAIVPDGQLRFILDSILQYGMTSIRSVGDIQLLTKSCVLQKENIEETVFEKDRKYIEIIVTFTSYKKPMEKSMQQLGTPSPREEIASDVLLRLVDATVKINQGVLRLEVDETKAKKSFFIKLPAERRKVASYESLSTSQLS
jgi:light-regulated signal transduction histidine kinase (bacteriophytochrome)